MRYSIKDNDFLILKRAHNTLVREWEAVKREFYARKAGFKEGQPRWPKGSGDESGRWSGGAMTVAARENATVLAARGNAEKCEAQYEADSKLCRIVKTPLCWEQAMKRRAACISGYDLPPFNF